MGSIWESLILANYHRGFRVAGLGFRALRGARFPPSSIIPKVYDTEGHRGFVLATPYLYKLSIIPPKQASCKTKRLTVVGKN